MSNNTIRFPKYFITDNKTTYVQKAESILNYVQREEFVKNLPYYLYAGTIGFEVIPKLNSSNTAQPNCDQQGDCTLTGAVTLVDTYHLEVGLPLLIISLVYAFYPLKYQAYDYFKERPAINEYELVKKILYIEIPLFIILTSIVLCLSFSGQIPIISSANNTIEQLMHPVYVVWKVANALQYSVAAGALWMISHMIRKEFQYYYARAVIKNMPSRTDNVERLNRVNTALSSYNKYLVRRLKVEIDFSKVYSRIVIEPKINDCIKSISESFDDNDKLAPARWLSQTINPENAEEIFLRSSLRTTIKESSDLIIPIIATIISIVALFLPHQGT